MRSRSSDFKHAEIQQKAIKRYIVSNALKSIAKKVFNQGLYFGEQISFRCSNVTCVCALFSSYCVQILMNGDSYVLIMHYCSFQNPTNSFQDRRYLSS